MTDFQSFWQAYPRKVGKLAAKKAWDKALREDAPEAIISGLDAQLPTLRSTDKQFIPHPSTWLNQGRWMDEVESEPETYERMTEAQKTELAKWATQNPASFKASRHGKDWDKLYAEGYLQPREATG